MTADIELLVDKARNGDKSALSTLVKHVQNKIYGFSMRMLGFPEYAAPDSFSLIIKEIIDSKKNAILN